MSTVDRVDIKHTVLISYPGTGTPVTSIYVLHSFRDLIMICCSKIVYTSRALCIYSGLVDSWTGCSSVG